MGGSRTFLLFICITHFFAVNGEQVPPSSRPENQDAPPPPPKPSPSSPPSPKISPSPTVSVIESPRLQLVYPVIQAFKQKVNYDPYGITKTWNGNNICRDYKGFMCYLVPDIKEKALAGVDFNNYNLGGPNLTITDFITGLPDIVFFQANSNNFTGSIPTGINKLRYLKELDLSNNMFTGNFPYQALGVNKLLVLDVRFNSFYGVIPPQVFLLNLDYLFINNNNFSQKLPDNLGSTPVHFLNLANNKFIGGIPPSIGQANHTLLEVVFLKNQLSGCLPYEIGLLKKAEVFDVAFNNLTGPIPHSFQCLKKMEVLNLAYNKFYGMVPEAVCSLPELTNFTLSYNYFTKLGPRCRELVKIGVVDIKMNCILDLPNQRSSADCAKFFSTTHSCANEKSLTYVPCSTQVLESTGVSQLSAPRRTPVQAPRRRSYEALFRHYVVHN